MAALHAEIDLVADAVGGSMEAGTVYFGGGTPSYLSPAQLEALLTHLWRRVHVRADTEVTFELHPGIIRQKDFEDRIAVLEGRGVNRWVFGVQSMDERVLKKLNRGHGRAEVGRLLQLLHDRRAANVSVDLMFGLPHQTVDNWYETLVTLLSLGVTKFNIFPLMFKMSDPISLTLRKQPELFPDSRDRLLMHFIAEHVLFASGFRRGPVFYYAKDEHHSRQQESKFDDIEDINLVPLGVSGFGYVGHTQYFNNCDMDGYIETVENGNPSVWVGFTLPLEERMRRAVMFGLRSNGVSRSAYEERYGVDPLRAFEEEFATLFDLDLVRNVEGTILLTDRGAVHVDGIALLFVSDDVKRRVQDTNSTIVDFRRDLREVHDFFPLGRLGSFPAELAAGPKAPKP